jgi:hypothetical protein
MGFHEPWLHQSADEVIAEVLAATAVSHPILAPISLDRLKAEGTIELHFTKMCLLPTAVFPPPAAKWSYSANDGRYGSGSAARLAAGGG